MHRVPRLVLVIAGLAVLVPAAALAGKKVTVGDQVLQFKASFKPAKAKARNVKFKFESTYKSTTPGAQPNENSNQIILLMPKGAKLNPSAVPACKRSALDSSKGNPAVCPAKSQIGTGSVDVNASPAIKQLIHGTIVVYNTINDTGENGQPKGTHNLTLFITTSIGIKTTFPFRVEKTGNGRVKLVGQQPKPSKPGYTPGNFSLQRVQLTVHAKTKKSFITNPPTCTKKGWLYTFTITNYFGQKSITAKHRQHCHK